MALWLFLIPKIPSLRSEITHLRQTIDPTKQEFELPVRRTRSILRYHMTAETDLDERKSPLSMRRSKHAGPRQGAVTKFAVVGHEKGVRGCRLESLRAVPSHVLDHEECA